MKTKKVFSILCLFCAGFLLLQPVISMLLMSVKDYKPIAGILNSPYVGLDNMADLLQSPNLIRILRNTIIIQLFAILIGAAYIFVAFRAICALQNKAAKAVGVILFALPAILPVDAYMMILYTFVPSEMLIRSSVLLQIIAGAEHGLRFSAVFVIGALFTNDNSVGSEKKYMILFIAIKLLSILTLDTGFMNSFYNPLTYEHLDTYSTYFYRVGFLQSAFSGCAAGYVVRLLIQFIPAVIGGILLILLLRKGHVNEASIHNTFREPVDNAYRGNSLFMAVTVLPVALISALILKDDVNKTALPAVFVS